MESLIEIISYANKFNSHLVGVKVIQGPEPKSGMIYINPQNDTKWKVYGGGSLPANAHKKGYRAITLIPINEEGSLDIGVTLKSV